MVIKYLYPDFPLQDPSKFTQIGIIGKRLEDYLGGEKYI
jgi:hypothetical protein